MAEDLTEYYRELGVRVRYLHSDIDTLERIEILRDLRRGEFDVLVGINLLREGLDLPEVSLVAILDADKEGFLRSPRSLIQTIGRAARNVNGRVIMYADRETVAMKHAIERDGPPPRDPGGVQRGARHRARDGHPRRHEHQSRGRHDRLLRDPEDSRRPARTGRSRDVDTSEQIQAMRAEMFTAAEALDFERAARLRDELKRLEALVGKDGGARRRRRVRPVRERREEEAARQRLTWREQLEQRGEQGDERRRPRPLQALSFHAREDDGPQRPLTRPRRGGSLGNRRRSPP